MATKAKDDDDLSQYFYMTAVRPQSTVKNSQEPTNSKIKDLIDKKSEVIKSRNHPPMGLRRNLKRQELKDLGKFDVILMDPPWEEYEKRVKGSQIYESKYEHYKYQIAKLDIQGLADNPSFIFLWVGSQHLDDGRQLFNKWGFKRCEDICWVKTHNKKQVKKDLPTEDPSQIFIRVKEHCLVGLKGDSKKASDPSFIHPNIDTDVVVCQQFDFGSTQKPQEVYEIIERFCLGRKRIQLFGNVMREGWLTVGLGLVEQNYSPEYLTWFQGDDMYPSRKDYKGGRKVGTTPDIENNRPKSPAKQATAPVTNQPVTLKI